MDVIKYEHLGPNHAAVESSALRGSSGCCALQRAGSTAGAPVSGKHLLASTSGKVSSFRKGRWSIYGTLWSPLTGFFE